jgi:hypothetical protein
MATDNGNVDDLARTRTERGGAKPPERTGPDIAETTAPKRAKYPCLRCRKNVTKNSKSVKCSTCDQWVHSDCEQMSAELFNILANPERYGGSGILWNCQSCMASAARLEKLVRNLEGSVKMVEERVRGTEEEVRGLETRMGKLEAAAQRKDEDTDKKLGRTERNIFEEMEEREARKLNVLFHKIGECENETASGAERIAWDTQSCENIFKELRLNITQEAIKLCRRVGERGEEPRPLIVGFYLDVDRAKLLQSAKKLDQTKFSTVSVGPDLTRKQREREAGMRAEADKRNANLLEEDKAKTCNWLWWAAGERSA